MKSKKDKRIKTQMENVKEKMPLVFYLTMFIFFISCITAAVLFSLYLYFSKKGWITEFTIVYMVIILLIASVVISTSLVRGLGNKIIFRSLRTFKDATKAVANGDFTQRLVAPREKEVAEICESFNEMVNKLGNNELLARDFVSNVSHQFRTPLSSIHGYAQLLENDDLTEEERLEYISVIKEKSISLSELMNDILELARLEHLNTGITKELFSLDEQLRKCVLSLENKFSAKNLEVVMELQTVNYLGNRELLAEVWHNLLENSIKFSHENGTITISLESDFDNVRVGVKDNGIGMSLDTQMRMYDRFYRGKEALNQDGSGLGMAMVKNIIAKHGGDIKVFSEPDKGSEFIVSLPLE